MSAGPSAEGIVLLGAEMLTWSDAAGERGAFGGLLAPSLVHETGAAAGRVLVAGPTTAAVVADLAARFDGADVLVRSWIDAQALRAALPAEIGVYCGPLDRFARRGESYAVVVAVAGLDRLHSAEEETPRASDVLSWLAGLVAADGELVVGVGNDAGVDRLLSLDAAGRHGDADWPDGTAAASLDPSVSEVETLLTEAGLGVARVWFCHGRRTDPLVAAPASTLTAYATDPVLLRELARAYDVRDAAAPPIKDPAETVRSLSRQGMAAATAPLAVLHLRRGRSDAGPPESAALLVCEPGHDGAPPVAYRLSPGSDGWRRTLLGEPAIIEVTAGLTRDTAALVSAVPAGESVAAALERCIAAHDLAAAGILIRAYRDLLRAAATDDLVPGTAVPWLPRTVAVGEEPGGPVLQPIDPGWRASVSAPVPVVLVRGLLDLGADLLGRGVRHPWSPAASAREVARALAPAAGLEDLDPLLDAALALDRQLRPEGTAPDFDAPGNAGRLSYAELSELVGQLGARAAQADEHVVWLLKRMQVRQRALRAARGQINALEGSREMWIGRRVLVLRSLLRRWRRRRAAKAGVPEGHWTGGRNPDLDEFRIEEELLPPGYEPDPQLEIVPTEDPAIDPTLDPQVDPD